MSDRLLDRELIASHNSSDSCWVIVNDIVYDVTDFLDHHPGGSNSILRYAGKDATEEYHIFHMPGTIESTLPSEKRIGRVDPTTITMTAESTSQPSKLSQSTEPPISTCMNLHDIEHAASQILTSRAYTYFHSAAESLQSLKSNLNDWKKISFRPRTLRSVKRVSVECHIMGAWSPLPIFIAPAAMARLAHDEGELCLAKAAARRKIPYCVSTYASMQQHQIAATKLEDGQQPTLFFQLYVPKSKSETIERVKMARRLGFKALVITIDTPVVGKREEDERYKVETDYKSGIADTPPLQERSGDYSDTPVLRGVHSSTLAWHDLKWIQEAWGNQGPVILKGIQSAEDAALAAAAGVDGIYLSNHGGRQLDFAPSSIHTLMEIRKFCPHVLKELQVYIDGGVRRGSDIIKALCLGAHAVSLGRPFMYGLGAYGEAGVLKVIDILNDEIQTTMRLLGVTSLSQLDPQYVNTAVLERDLISAEYYLGSKL